MREKAADKEQKIQGDVLRDRLTTRQKVKTDWRGMQGRTKSSLGWWSCMKWCNGMRTPGLIKPRCRVGRPGPVAAPGMWHLWPFVYKLLLNPCSFTHMHLATDPWLGRCSLSHTSVICFPFLFDSFYICLWKSVFAPQWERSKERGSEIGCLHYHGNLLDRQHAGSASMALSCSQVTFQTACPDPGAFPAVCMLQKATGLLC